MRLKLDGWSCAEICLEEQLFGKRRARLPLCHISILVIEICNMAH